MGSQAQTSPVTLPTWTPTPRSPPEAATRVLGGLKLDLALRTDHYVSLPLSEHGALANCKVLLQVPGVTITWSPGCWAGQAALEKKNRVYEDSISQSVRVAKGLYCRMMLTLKYPEKTALVAWWDEESCDACSLQVNRFWES